MQRLFVMHRVTFFTLKKNPNFMEIRYILKKQQMMMFSNIWCMCIPVKKYLRDTMTFRGYGLIFAKVRRKNTNKQTSLNRILKFLANGPPWARAHSSNNNNKKNLVWHSHNFLLPCITVISITFIFKLYFPCFVDDELPAFIIAIYIF